MENTTTELTFEFKAEQLPHRLRSCLKSILSATARAKRSCALGGSIAHGEKADRHHATINVPHGFQRANKRAHSVGSVFVALQWEPGFVVEEVEMD